jgi:hypothetical protein
VPIGEIVLEDGLGLDVIKSSHLANAMLGARSFVHLGRSLAGQAFRHFLRSGITSDGKNLTVFRNVNGGLSIKTS